MPKFFIPAEILRQSHYNTLGAKFEDDKSVITKQYIARYSYSEELSKRAALAEAYATLSKPERRAAYDEALHQRSLEIVELLSDAELAAFNQVIGIILQAAAPDKAGLQLNSVGGGRYVIGDLASSKDAESDPTKILKVDNVTKILSGKEREKFWHLFRIIALADGGELLTTRHPEIYYFDKVFGCDSWQDLFSVREIKKLLAHVQSKSPAVMQQIADNFRQVDQMSECFTTYHSQIGKAVGYNVGYGIINSLNEASSFPEESRDGLVTLRFNRNSLYKASSPQELREWFGNEVAPNVVTLLQDIVLPPRFIAPLCEGKVDEIKNLTELKKARSEERKAINQLYLAIASGDKVEVAAAVTALEGLGVDLTSLNAKSESSPILFAVQRGLSNELTGYLIEKTKPDFQHDILGVVLSDCIHDMTPLCSATGLPVDKLAEIATRHPDEYLAEKCTLKQVIFLSGKQDLPLRNLMPSLNSFVLKDLIKEESEPLNRDLLGRMLVDAQAKETARNLKAQKEEKLILARSRLEQSRERRAEHNTEELPPSSRPRVEGAVGASQVAQSADQAQGASASMS